MFYRQMSLWAPWTMFALFDQEWYVSRSNLYVNGEIYNLLKYYCTEVTVVYHGLMMHGGPDI